MPQGARRITPHPHDMPAIDKVRKKSRSDHRKERSAEVQEAQRETQEGTSKEEGQPTTWRQPARQAKQQEPDQQGAETLRGTVGNTQK